MIKFAIYTSFYNSEKYIDAIFQNVLNQSYTNWIWFITDDFSDDNTGLILKSKIGNDPRIVYVTQGRKKEMYWQPNKFIPAEFEYIILMDADDEFCLDSLLIYSQQIKEHPEAVVIASDYRKLYKNLTSIHSISYIKNDEKFSNRIQKFHPNVDYLNNLNYYAFGMLRCFKNISNLEFKINSFNDIAEDSYRIMCLNSYGKYLHIPRNLYTWNYFENSVSHSKINKDFNANFNIGLELCKQSTFEPYYDFNDCYKEFNSLLIFDYKYLPHNISIISPNLTIDQQRKICSVYPDKTIFFNSTKGQKLYTVILNYFEDMEALLSICREIKTKNAEYGINFYYLDESKHISNESKDYFLKKKAEIYMDFFNNNFPGFSYFLYIRHLNFTVNHGISHSLC